MSEVFEIPVAQIASYEIQVPLDDVLFKLVFNFNERDSFWYMDVRDGLTDTIVRAGVKVVSQWDLLRLCKIAGRPDGQFVAVPKGAEGIEADTLQSLGTEVLLTYTGDT